MSRLPSAPAKTQRRTAETFERVQFESRKALRAWLAKNHGRAKSIWCVTWKKRPGAPYIPYADIVEEALCFGWIDSLPRALDDARTMLLLSPRKRKSNWSKSNKERAERMIAAGKMTSAGMAVIELAKADGRWSFLDDVEALAAPGDLQAALKGVANAKENWERFPASTRRGILEWIKNAMSAETRKRRIETTADLAGKNIRANQYRQIVPSQTQSRPIKARKSAN